MQTWFVPHAHVELGLSKARIQTSVTDNLPEPLYLGHACGEGCEQPISTPVKHEEGQNLQVQCGA